MVAQKCKKKKKKKQGPYERLLENPETEGPRKLFLPENNFKPCDTVSFLKKQQILETFSHALKHI